MNRSGVALIIAISVLAALLFLALPFLFSQSASVAGARSAAQDGVARRGVDRASGLATAMGIYATGLHRSRALTTQLGTAQFAYVQLPQQISDTGSAGAIRYPGYIDTSWRLILEPGADWTMATGTLSGVDRTDALHGAILEDESRRIDPNDLDEYGWAVVLRRAEIQDPWTVRMNWTSSAPFFEWERMSYGRLARTLALWRPGNSPRRFNRLEDLLGADPHQPVTWTFTVSGSPVAVSSYYGCTELYPKANYPARGQSDWPVDPSVIEADREAAEIRVAIKVDSDHIGFRVAALTQAELERLRPLLSFLVPGQGRSGLIDYGTVVATGQWNSGWWDSTNDALSPSAMSVGSALVGSRTWVHSATASRRNYASNGWSTAGEALAIDALPAMNINTVPSSSGMTRLYLGQATTETDATYKTRIEEAATDNRGRWWRIEPVDDPIGTYGDLPLLRWLDPRTGDGTISFERPPLSIAGFGIVAIEGLAQSRDAEGRPGPARRRRTVVQTVPQERPLEAAWSKQGDFEALVRLRHGSWVMAGPHPTNRIADTNATLNNIADWGADAATGKAAMEALDGPGWLEPAPVCSFAKNPILSFDWVVPFGLTGAKPWADILKDTSSGKAPTVSSGLGVADLKATGTTVGALSAQGLHLSAGRELAWDLATAGSPLAVDGGTDELSARHISVRFSLQSVSGDVTLLEARAQSNGLDSDDDGTPDQPTAEQNLWRVEYRHSAQRLVLVIANAALPWGATERTRRGFGAWNMGSDTVADNAADARATATGAAFAPADPGRTVEFHYAVPSGLVAKRWYQLQVFCASDRPGLHGLTLDGVVGRDATWGGVDMNSLGDHYTSPCLRLSGAVSPAGQLLGGALASPSTISVTYPQTLALTDLLPERGLVRIDDEYFSYTDLSGGSGGSGSLTGVLRARRITTDQDASEDLDGDGVLDTEDLNGNGVLDTGEDANSNGVLDTEDRNGNGVLDVETDARRFPVGQRHAVGALVTPGWYQRTVSGGSWLRGECTLVQDFPKDPATGTLSGWPDPDTDGLYEFDDGVAVPLTVTGGTWPTQGFVQFGIHRAAFTYAGSTLTLYWTGSGVINATGSFPKTDVWTCRVVSMEVNGPIADSGSIKRFADGGALQLLDPATGLCEWVRYDVRADRSSQTPSGFYFIEGGGWDMTAYTSPGNPIPAVQPRGAMRTPQRASDWPKSTTKVLPVQTQLAGIAGLESGDVITVAPDSSETAYKAPVQMVVRHAARDGYPAAATLSGKQYETAETWFALAHGIDFADTVLADPGTSRQVILVGRGWCGDDLSMSVNRPQRRGALPRKLLLASSSGTPAARVYVGCPDPVGTGSAGDLILDDLCAGVLPGGTDANAAATDSAVNGSEITAINGSASGSLDATASALPATVTASTAVFTLKNTPRYGLCQIDGEVFAFRRVVSNLSPLTYSATEAVLIARALLGSEAKAHTLAGTVTVASTSGSGTRQVAPTLPVVVLPMGPVAELCTTLTAGGYAAGSTTGLDVVEVPFENYYKDPTTFDHPNKTSNAGDSNYILEPPFVVIHDPSSGAVEITRLLKQPKSNQRTTASWLRGLYGTSDLTWTANYTPAIHATSWVDSPSAASVNSQDSGKLNPVVIGYWPRYTPPLPAKNYASTNSEALRCRSFAWAGFPLRLSGARFDPGISALTSAGILDVTLDTTGGCSRVQALALAAQEATSNVFDWENAWDTAEPLSATAKTGITAPFNWDRFKGHEVDGAEARINWTVGASLGTLAGAAAEAGRAPRISLVRLRCVAPTRILAVEEVR